MNKQLCCFLYLISYFLPINIIAQGAICDGNIGDNIFENGDFGEGTPINVINPDNITTSYNYDVNGTPHDGSYTLTKNMGAWSDLFQAWLPSMDNSDDPNGYFMVVNADYTPGIFYEEVINNLCENTLYVFSADVINVVRRGVANHILPNVSFLLNEEVQYTTGNIQQDERWHTFGFTFSTKVGETSLKLSLRNNAPGGIGNDLGLDNITFRPCGPKAEILPYETENICEDGDPISIFATITGEQYENEFIQWQQSFDGGGTWQNLANEASNSFAHTEKSAGFYYYRYLAANSSENINNTKCRVNSNTKIIQVVPKFYEIAAEICEGLDFEVGNSRYNTSGIYTDSLISSIGCDSIVTLNLTVMPDEGIEADVVLINPSCHDYTDGSIQVRNILNARMPFTVQLDTELANQETIFSNLAVGDFSLIIEDAIGCSYQETVELVEPELFQIFLGEEQIIDLGDEVSLEPQSNYPIAQYQWSPVEENCTNCNTSSFTPVRSQFYKLTALNAANCIALDSVFITVRKTRELFIPNTISPNGDGINDFFSIHASIPNVQSILQLSIFDRWGTMVFDREGILPTASENIWDGTYKGKSLDTGVYIYLAKVLFLDGEEEVISGDFTIIR